MESRSESVQTSLLQWVVPPTVHFHWDLTTSRTALTANRHRPFFVSRSWSRGPGCIFCAACSDSQRSKFTPHVIQAQVDPASQGEQRDVTLIVMSTFHLFAFFGVNRGVILELLYFFLTSSFETSISNSFFFLSHLHVDICNKYTQ